MYAPIKLDENLYLDSSLGWGFIIHEGNRDHFREVENGLPYALAAKLDETERERRILRKLLKNLMIQTGTGKILDPEVYSRKLGQLSQKFGETKADLHLVMGPLAREMCEEMVQQSQKKQEKKKS